MVESLFLRARSWGRRHGDAAVGALAAAAMMLVVVWADILGHGLGFERSASAVEPLANSRLFFLIGFTAAAALAVVLAKSHVTAGKLPARVVLAISVAGTMLYGLACVQPIFPPAATAICGLFLCGAGYYAATMLIYCQLAKVRRLPSAVAAITVALLLKTVFGSQLTVILPQGFQIAFACLLPVGFFVCLGLLDGCDPTALDSYRSRKTLAEQGVYDLVFLLVAVSLMLAALRGTSHLGLWGVGYSGSPVSSPAGYLVVALALSAFTYLTVVRNSNNQMLVRFQPAFVVLAAGFVLYVLQDSFLVAPESVQVIEWLYLTVELFGHLLSGTLIITAIRTTDSAPWRFQGISDAAFGLVAIPWIFLAQDATFDVRPLMVVAIFLVMVAAIRPMSTRPLEIERCLDFRGKEDASAFAPVEDRPSEPTAQRPEPEDGATLERRLAACHGEIAKAHGLSSRETDVFMLLAQGRSRPYICEVLYLSDGTVKTHISHIYRKFGVHARQELLDAVQDEVARTDACAVADCAEARAVSGCTHSSPMRRL